ncbi:S8 family peptidase [Alicyclobacillus suci]|nr:S8 family peptidase [Alicyclobacillus suci]
MIVGETERNEPFAVLRLGKGTVKSLADKVDKYETEIDKRSGKPRYNTLISSIDSIRESLVKELWTGPLELLPAQEDTLNWWEVWLYGGIEDPQLAQRMRLQFAAFAKREGIEVDIEQRIEFADRQVFILHASYANLSNAVSYLDSVAELRPPSQAIRDVHVLEHSTRKDFDNAAKRVIPPRGTAPTITLLDTGLNHTHPLLEPAVLTNGLHTIDPSSVSTGDYLGHGTRMAGVALYDDMSAHFLSAENYQLPAHLESVRIPLDSTDDERRLWGKTLSDAVYLAESMDSDKRRIYYTAISGTPLTRGLPSSWSATMDQLCFNQGEKPRLIAVAAGNVTTFDISGYPSRNLSSQLHDPAQARNVITVGAITDLTEVSNPVPGYEIAPIAGAGQLSPHSTVHIPKNDAIKPDIVCEGGNVGWTGEFAEPTLEGLSIVTTSERFLLGDALTTVGGTSPATATACRMMAQIWEANPDLRPETIRGLLIHSASWTNALRQQFPNKRDLLRSCGYGVPDVQFACKSATSAVTLIAEGMLRARHMERVPTRRKGQWKWIEHDREILVFDLPWPDELLRSLGETKVELRVTLSYFCDPSPKHTLKAYQGAGLKWDLQGPHESESMFIKRVNLAEREAGENNFAGANDWEIGIQARSRGTVQSDRWAGIAADLAVRRKLAVYPVMGWWDGNKTRYPVQDIPFSLIVSVISEDVTLDIYNQIDVPVPVLV